MKERRNIHAALASHSEEPGKVPHVADDNQTAKLSSAAAAFIQGESQRRVSPQASVTQTTSPFAGRHARIALTTRLDAPTAEALRRAYLEQKLAGRLPDTQQEIVQEAVQQWLREHGFLADC